MSDTYTERRSSINAAMPDGPTSAAEGLILRSPESVTLADQSLKPVRSKLLLKIVSAGVVGVAVGVRVAVAVGEEVRVEVDVGLLVTVGEGVNVSV